MRSFSEILADTMVQNETAREETTRTRMIDDAIFRTTLFTTAPSPAWASELGVAYPCSPDELRRAFRRRALETHPDRLGGSSVLFVAATRAFEQGLSEIAASPRTIATRVASAPRSTYRRAA